MPLTLLLLAAVEAARDVPVAPVLILMALGVLIAIAGHITASRTLVGMGIFLLFLATAAMVLGGLYAYTEDPGGDPRPPEDPATPDF